MIMTVIPRNGLRFATTAWGRHELLSLFMCVADTGFMRYFFVKCRPITSFHINLRIHKPHLKVTALVTEVYGYFNYVVVWCATKTVCLCLL